VLVLSRLIVNDLVTIKPFFLSLKKKNFCPTNRCDVSSNAKSTHMSQRRRKR
jgi:hypothetical protein